MSASRIDPALVFYTDKERDGRSFWTLKFFIKSCLDLRPPGYAKMPRQSERHQNQTKISKV